MINLWNVGCTGLTAGRLAAPIALVVLLAGCVTAPSDNQEQSDLIAEKLDSYVVEEGVVRHDVTDQNVARLWQEFNILRRSGNLTEAKAKLSEAIDISPNDPALWSSAAEIELKESSHARAENYAAKSNVLVNYSEGAGGQRRFARCPRSRNRVFQVQQWWRLALIGRKA